MVTVKNQLNRFKYDGPQSNFQKLWEIKYIGRKGYISAIIVTDDYLRYKEPKSSYNFLVLF